MFKIDHPDKRRTYRTHTWIPENTACIKTDDAVNYNLNVCNFSHDWVFEKDSYHLNVTYNRITDIEQDLLPTKFDWLGLLCRDSRDKYSNNSRLHKN